LGEVGKAIGEKLSVSGGSSFNRERLSFEESKRNQRRERRRKRERSGMG